ncbi:hypothetical protein JDV02_010107 [Purpureocillium takamizusanense]|uniref:Uncharacterized protein n=1 Tax=Purpureocillium takamizusanense TaxID=2060973 RepID=A0A9Q8QR63_9HYPO|nr:uncharacterized protein JDV02_010107 [Purpureocillium takamizusanense]UNI24355.1 hypothetical protein JDV02_010107 [Purpureocillium takamizusanense]
MQAVDSSAAEPELAYSSFCPIVPCEVLATVKKGQCSGSRDEAKAFLETCVRDMPAGYAAAVDIPIESWHVHHYMCKVNECPGTGGCSASHLGASRACRSGIVGTLRKIFPVESEWRGQELPHVSSFSIFQLRAWSMLECYITVGLLGKALDSKEVVAWSQTMLQNPVSLIMALQS